MNKKKLILSIVVSVVVCAVLALCVVLGSKVFTPNYDGKIIVEVVDKDGTVIEDKKIKFDAGDTLIELVKENFENVSISGEGEWQMIDSIESIKNEADWSYYISIYVDDVESPVGIASIEFVDGTKISFKLIKNPYA